MSGDTAIDVLARAGSQGLTPVDLAKALGISKACTSQVLRELKANGSARGPFRIGRSTRYFSATHAPSRQHVEDRIEEWLRNAGLKLTSLSDLEAIARPWPKAFFKDAISALKGEGAIVELRGPRKSRLYLHREPLLEQLRVEREGATGARELEDTTSSLSLDQQGRAPPIVA
jgi:hypothetical protein